MKRHHVLAWRIHIICNINHLILCPITQSGPFSVGFIKGLKQSASFHHGESAWLLQRRRQWNLSSTLLDDIRLDGSCSCSYRRHFAVSSCICMTRCCHLLRRNLYCLEVNAQPTGRVAAWSSQTKGSGVLAFSDMFAKIWLKDKVHGVLGQATWATKSRQRWRTPR